MWCDDVWLTVRFETVPTWAVWWCRPGPGGLVNVTVVESAPVPARTTVATPESPPAILPLPESESALRVTTDRHLGDAYLRLGAPEEAVRVYRRHLERHPGDAEARRSLGLALLGLGRAEEGAGEVEMAYRIEPMLADRPVSREAFSDDETFRGVLDEALRYATESGTAGAWLAAAVMLQGRGNVAAARSAMAHAAAAGLDRRVVRAMEGVLGGA